MITTEDQELLFKLISNYLEKDITCTAIGGTAMMFAGYKTTTKDIDLVFNTEADRKAFIRAIEQLGYREKPLSIYDEKRQKHKNKPKMYSRGEERFDLFVKNVFGFTLEAPITQRQEFIGKKELIIRILSAELLILLKAITRRERDHEDILDIAKREPDLDWDLIVDEAIRQRKNNEWLLIDLEETMQELKKVIFIKKKYFDKIYKAEARTH